MLITLFDTEELKILKMPLQMSLRFVGLSLHFIQAPNATGREIQIGLETPQRQ